MAHVIDHKSEPLERSSLFCFCAQAALLPFAHTAVMTSADCAGGACAT